MSATKDHHNKAKALPETGSENNGSNNATLFGGLFAALGSLLLFGRRKTKQIIQYDPGPCGLVFNDYTCNRCIFHIK